MDAELEKLTLDKKYIFLEKSLLASYTGQNSITHV